MHLAEVLVGDVGADLGGRDVGVAEEGLDAAEVGRRFRAIMGLSADLLAENMCLM